MKNKILLTTLLASSINSGALAADNSQKKRFYIGFEGGINKPFSNEIKFTAGDDKMAFSLKRSAMYSARAGYFFAPGMAIELSYTHQPQFKVGFNLDASQQQQVQNGTLSIPGTTKAIADVVTLNLVYNLMPLAGDITPYFIGGAGIAKVDVKPLALPLAQTLGNAFKVNRSKGKYFAWQAGLGMQKEITHNLYLDASAKLQAIHNIKLRYELMNKSTFQMEKSYVKKTLGGVELGVGLTYKF